VSAEALHASWSRAARWRGVADDVASWLPLPLMLAVLAWRWQGIGAGLLVGLIGLSVLGAYAWRRATRFDQGWLVRQLDARAEMEDSADLLFAAAPLNPLQRLQRERIEARLAAGTPSDLRAGWSSRRIAAAWAAGLVAIVATLWWPADPAAPPPLAPSAEGTPPAPGIPRLTGQRLRIVPPAYTGLPARYETTLDARAPQGSRLEWTLRFAPDGGGGDLAFHQGARLALTRDGGDWRGARALDTSLLYRVLPRGAEAQKPPPLHRLDAVADTPPTIKVIAPDHGLSIVTPGQRSWTLRFDVADDYGVDATAQLRVTLAQGEGENITFRERTISVRGTGGARLRRFAPVLDLRSLGFAKGDDLIAQLIVRDHRTPGPQIVHGPSLILRWPPDLGSEGTGLEGMAKKVLPAYFRSQRQIIIDAEALLRQRRALAPDRFVAKSDAIGVDQRILRMRYGQFLGEEAAGDSPPPPTNDAETPATDAHGHEGEAPAPAATFGQDADVLGEYGHTHDESEAATLLDPDTRAILKQALDQMWQSELHLRQGDPAKALPFAYKALTFIKQVQQATRIFLARVGPELPPIDEARRMTGKREGLISRALPLVPREGGDAVPAAVWRALADAPGGPRVGGADLDALERWLRGQSRIADPLSLVSAIDAVRRDPACTRCRATLRGLLWRALARPPAQILRRAHGDAAGRRYLDALR
jgi:hypothetical protein